MSYLSMMFAAMVLSLLLIYRILPKSVSSGKGIVLLLGSLFFYCCFDIRYVIFLLFSALSTYFCAKTFAKTERKRRVLTLCIIANALVWSVIKVLPWTVLVAGNLLEYMGVDVELSFTPLLVPIGISYFTLQAIGYTVDVYKEKTKPETSFWKYLLFLSYFPAIVQGPISRYDKLMPQLIEKKKFSFEKMRSALFLILVGIAKKLVIADRLGVFVNACFDNYTELYGALLYLGAVGYAIQLYADFSGCVDICRGVSRLFDVELENNFRRPYLAESIKDFWSRWHISLSNWLRDYIYIPLGGNRKGTSRKYINLLITFLVSGIWHGAGFSFFLWGTLHAVYQIIDQSTAAFRRKIKQKIGVREDSLGDRIFKIVITFNLVTFAWIFFRSVSLSSGIEYIARMFSHAGLTALFNGSVSELGIAAANMWVLIVNILILFAVEMKTKDQDEAVGSILQRPIVIRWAICFLMIFDVLLFGMYGTGYDLSGFMYGGF